MPDPKYPTTDPDQSTDSIPDKFHSQEMKDATTTINRLIQLHQDQSDALHETEIELATTFETLAAPLKQVFSNTQKHTQFRASLFTLFADEPIDFELLHYERDHED